MEKKEVRSSNFELLRILSMMMIFIYHYSIYGGIIAVGSYTINKLAALFLFVFGRVGVNLFIVLSGYFLIDSKFKLKRIIKLVLQVLFYAILMELLSDYILKIKVEFKYLKLYITPIFNGIYWFITCYVILYLISPFLNKMIKLLSKENCEKIIIVSLIILALIPSLFLRNNFISSDLFVWYVFMYFVGAYIKIHKFDFKNSKTSKIISISYPFVCYATIIILILINKHFNLQLDQYYFCALNSIIGFIGTIGIFLFFKNLKIKNSKIINHFAQSSFATYLISEHISFKNIFWNSICKTTNFLQKPLFIFLLHILACVILTWLIVGFIEFIRIYVLEKNIFKIKIFDKYIDKIDSWMQV